MVIFTFLKGKAFAGAPFNQNYGDNILLYIIIAFKCNYTQIYLPLGAIFNPNFQFSDNTQRTLLNVKMLKHFDNHDLLPVELLLLLFFLSKLLPPTSCPTPLPPLPSPLPPPSSTPLPPPSPSSSLLSSSYYYSLVLILLLLLLLLIIQLFPADVSHNV